MDKLKDIMHRDVSVIHPGDTIMEAALKMRDGDFGMMPVGENERLLGAVTDRDIVLRAIAEGKGPQTPVREVMSAGIAWAYEDDTVEAAAALMSEQQIRRLPVVDQDGRLVGIVALGDFAVEKEDIQAAAKALSGISQHS